MRGYSLFIIMGLVILLLSYIEPDKKQNVVQIPVKEEPKQENSKSEPAKDEPQTGPVKDKLQTEPVKDEPAKTEPVKDELQTEPVKDEPVKDEPVKDEPVKTEPQIEPVKDNPQTEIVKEEAKTEPVKDEPQTEPVKDEPQTEPVKDEPKQSPAKRMIQIQWIYDFPPENPDEKGEIFLLIKEKNLFFSVIPGQEVLCNQYDFIANHAGYASENGKIDITADNNPYVLEIPLKALNREIIFSFTTKEDPYKKILPDLVKLGDHGISNRTFMKPGKYALMAQKEGYSPVEMEIDIKAGSAPYFLKAIFTALEKDTDPK